MISRQSRVNYLAMAGILKNKRGEVKNQSRQKAYLNIRTSISMAAMMRCIHRKCHPRVIHSSDDFTVVLNGFDEAPELLTTKSARKIMKKLNLGIATTQNRGKRRVIVFNCTMNYYGVTCMVVRFADRNFGEFRKVPKILKMTETFFVMLHHPDISDAKITEFMYLKCIIPCAVASREKSMRSTFEPLQEILCSQSSAASSNVSGAELEADLQTARSAVQELQAQLEAGLEGEEEEMDEYEEQGEDSDGGDEDEGQEEEGGDDGGNEASGTTTAADLVRIGDMEGARAFLQQYAQPMPDPDLNNAANASSVSSQSALLPHETNLLRRFSYFALLFDGAIPQIQALLGKVNKKCIEKGLPCVMGKTPGGASPTTAVNDAGDMHKASHALFRAALKGYRDYAEPDERPWKELKALMESCLDSESFRTVWKCMRAAPHILSDTFKTSTLQKAFHTAGTLVVRNTDKALVPDDVVMLSHCPAFCKLTDRKAAFVLSTIPMFTEIMEREGFISEEDFERVLGGEPDVDNCPPKSGMPLGLMSTSRQRACIINSPGWLGHMECVKYYKEEKEYEKLLREEQREAKKQKLREEEDRAAAVQDKMDKKKSHVRGMGVRCISAPICTRYKGDDGLTGKHACKGWVKCPNAFCRVWSCPNQECIGILETHSHFECSHAKPTH